MFELKGGDRCALSISGNPVGVVGLADSVVEYPADFSRDGVLKITFRASMPVGQIDFATKDGFRECGRDDDFSVYLPEGGFVCLDGRKIVVIPLP